MEFSSKQLPSLSALRVFEISSKSLSFTKAAVELGISQSAVSHQIKALETFLGVQLFIRDKTKLLLSPEGEVLADSMHKAFDILHESVDKIRSGSTSRSLNVSVFFTFSVKWLLPHLQSFRTQYPDIDIRVEAKDSLCNFTSDRIDVAIRYGAGVYPNLISELLRREQVFAVCSPKFLEENHVKSFSDLEKVTLLHDEGRNLFPEGPDWAIWLQRASYLPIKPTKNLYFTHSNLALQAAIDSQGVALGRTALVADDIKQGKLMRLFDVEIFSDNSYYLVYPQTKDHKITLQAFRRWIADEINKDPIFKTTANSGNNSNIRHRPESFSLSPLTY
ncbi:MAG: transcriptional regulator GcvA [Alphaproteobacteria bacterium]|nr:transcriptional regulator GcvA [Alphaproteobacteria bacterium]